MPLTYETAELIFEGHLDYRPPESPVTAVSEGGSSASVSGAGAAAEGSLVARERLLPWSWKVVCGQNPAYDYFSCQHQIFYKYLPPQ